MGTVVMTGQLSVMISLTAVVCISLCRFNASFMSEHFSPITTSVIDT